MGRTKSQAKSRAGRGHLSSIDLLPEAADPFVARAFADIRARRKLQKTILEDLNAGLADLGIPPISRSAFNRRVVKVMDQERRQGEVRGIAEIVAVKIAAELKHELPRTSGGQPEE